MAAYGPRRPGSLALPLLTSTCVLWLLAGMVRADPQPPECDPRGYEPERKRMVTEQIRERGVETPAVLAAVGRVPRHCFVPGPLLDEAYADHPLPIGMGQTISQPYIVALMTELLELKPSDRVLEIGTGSGYQAAVLAEVVRDVFTVEILEPLAREAESRLKALAPGRVRVRCADGYDGWEEQAPFDAIVVTAATGEIPPPLIRQLKPGGRMCIPLGGIYQVQQLTLVRKDPQGSVSTRAVLPVRFVPLGGGH